MSFESQTDTEVVAHLLDRELDKSNDAVEAAFKRVLDRLTGAYALAVLIDGERRADPGRAARQPAGRGLGRRRDVSGIGCPGSRPLHPADLLSGRGRLRRPRTAVGALFFDASGRRVERAIVQVSASSAMVEKGEYRHFMEKEIHEQPDSVQHTLSAYLDLVSARARPQLIDFAQVERIQIIACGTAFYAGQIGRYAFERLAGLPCDVEIASEFRYRDPAMTSRTLAVAVSQSGETADTLAGLTWCKAQGLKTAAVVNVHSSSMAREADILWPTHAGPEIGVASTKAFTAQVAALLALAVAAGVARGRIDAAREAELVKALFEAPRLIAEALKMDGDIRHVVVDLAKATDVLFLGRGSMFPLAMEGALKLKEISYIHAEGYAAGELKHGPIALIDEDTPTVALAPLDDVFEKTASNLQEVAARGGPVIMITPAEAPAPEGLGIRRIDAPDCPALIAPLVYAVPMQLLAYYTAVQKGTDVDQPRNLAKSVTVE
jgi:glucosamine--fructose-6-phosphate aminotransferase (isomerizing)